MWALFVSYGGAGWALLGNRVFVVRSVTVTGTHLLVPAQVTAAADVSLGTPLLSVDTGAVTRRVEAIGDVATQVGGDALEAADCHRRAVDPASPARGLAGTVAGASENPGKHVGLAIRHVGVRIPPLSDQTDVLGNVGVGRAGPLAIHDPMEVIRVRGIGGIHEVGFDSWTWTVLRTW